MSYILDALRRADAERERGSVPGIHAQPAMLGDADNEAPRPARPGLWIGLAFALVLLATFGWWLLGHDTAPPAAAPVRAVPLTVSPAPAPVPAAARPAVAAAPPAPMPAPPRASEPTRAAPAKMAVAKPAKPPPGAASLPTARAAAPTASVPAATEPRVYALSELPDEIRRELPALAVGGAMYSQNPANRMLIVNGQTFHEGDRLAPNLSLEQIRLKSAVLEYKGYRYGITY